MNNHWLSVRCDCCGAKIKGMTAFSVWEKNKKAVRICYNCSADFSDQRRYEFLSEKWQELYGRQDDGIGYDSMLQM